MLKKPELNRHAVEKIRELEGYGVTPTLEETIWLHLLGEQVQHPPGCNSLDLIGMPVKLGSTYLWPMTVAASIWWQECAVKWFDGHEQMHNYAAAFAMAHGRDGQSQTLRRLANYKDARKAIKKFARTLECTYEELIDALDTIHPDNDSASIEARDDDRVANLTGWDIVIADLCVLTGTTPDYWLYSSSLNFMITSYRMAMENHKSVEGTPHIPTRHPLNVAIANLHRAFLQILTDHDVEIVDGKIVGRSTDG